MGVLSSGLRRQLESSVLAARRAAEGAARAAVEGLGVFADRRPDYLDAERAALRNGLRAKWRQLGGDRDLLVAECAYEQWHRLLFARFLAENGLLLHPRFKAPVSLAECEGLAAELGEPDGWSVAARFASEIVPGIFPLEDPGVRLRLAPEGRHALEEILAGLPADVFVADDALGWVYQFWQKDKKDEVNDSERKIGGADLGPVTQLFTDNYMVRFLLENSLGAWWATRHPESPLVKTFDYLRIDNGGSPAAGSFKGWPVRVAEVTVMDPCCGSGHFLVEAFAMLWQMRVEEEGLSAVEAQDAVLRDNLFGLELDPRCVQIAMFAVALQAWKAGGGWRQLPVPNIACSGIPVKAPVEEWTKLARGDERLENALVRLHILFRDADSLGSLIDPKRATEIADSSGLQRSFDDVDWEDIAPLLDKASEAEIADPATSVLGAGAASIARAADYLSCQYTLVVTNVPYLGRGRQSDLLRSHLRLFFRNGSADLASACALRCVELAASNCSVALVLPETLFFLQSLAGFRQFILEHCEWNSYTILGAGAFNGISGEVVQPVLWISSKRVPRAEVMFAAADARGADGAAAKAIHLREGDLIADSQSVHRSRPGMKIAIGLTGGAVLLSAFARSVEGMSTGDNPRYRFFFWEIEQLRTTWRLFQAAPSSPGAFDGLDSAIRWEQGNGSLAQDAGARIQGLDRWGAPGILVGRMGAVVATQYLGGPYDKSCVVLAPFQEAHLPAIYAYTLHPSYEQQIRTFDKKVGIATASMVEIPFELDSWQQVALERFPDGLPKPWSDDPTQWLFEGRPEVSTAPLQVAVARLVGYRWPQQAESDDLDRFSDSDGIVCLSSVAGEAPAADRLQGLLAAAYGDRWSPSVARELLKQAGSKKKSIADWLRDEFFKHHCSVFGNRPFVWHIWDGQRGGFSALVNYHRLDRKTLEKLTYTYLGTDWIERQKAEIRDEVAGAEARLAAAMDLQRRLELILEGEAPYDIYVRWKEAHEQPIGWNPDPNDGVRLNIRPFVEAGVLRSQPNIHWRKDRGRNPDGTERLNDLHLTLADKQRAQQSKDRT
ncbi:hypothetical protein A5765_18800 [Mycolicibacterium celeriflavum]|uniref:DNA methyltransferase n=1 Tax=Mycolicibacterium celeriflavum TaxID=1249101 RepID=UPI0007FBB5A8|nr:DNA methyltransferase [Mycolicibacterium celeriflavum]OBG23487.1 hypothetical protein A5765_18800 [Mycolicibacterium celeriflavum]